MPYLATACLALIIGWVTLSPLSEPMQQLASVPLGAQSAPRLDKLVHLLAFAALAGPLAWRYPRLWWVVALAALAYGGLIEIVQPHVGRSMELADLLANGTGAFIGAPIAARIGRLRQVRRGV